jgi:superfamily I DNA/RNA helicase
VEKQLQPSQNNGDEVIVLDCTNEEDEAQQIVNAIAELIERGYVYKDMAILYRANYQVQSD